MSEATCTDNLLRLLGTDCSELAEGNYLINITKHQSGCNCCTNCTTGECTATLILDSGSSFGCADVANCINTNTATQTSIKNLLISLINSDASVQSAICGVNCGVSAPGNITNLTTTDSDGGVYDCGNPILNFTASSGATSYDIFEGATLLGNTVSTTFTVVLAFVGSHTYSVVAKNSGGSASGVSITVNVTACLTAPGNVTGTINVYNSGTATNYTCGLGFDVNFTDVATATYYQLFEGATQIGSNSATSNFVLTGQTAGSHTYTIRACNGVGCSTGTNFTVTVAACAVSKAVNLSGQTFSSSGNATDNTGRYLFPIDSTALGTAIATNNSGYTACGGGNGVYDMLNGFFIPPITGTYTFTFGAYIQSPNCNGALGMNMEAAIGVHAVNGIYSGLNWQGTTLWTCASTTPIPLTITQTLNAGTCYTLMRGIGSTGGITVNPGGGQIEALANTLGATTTLAASGAVGQNVMFMCDGTNWLRKNNG